MKTKKINIYTYSELSDKAKEKALAEYRETNDYPFLSEAITEKLGELLEENKIKDTNNTIKVFYSLSYCQGDGAIFEGTFEWKDYTVHIKQGGNYYHSKSKFIEIQKNDNIGFDIGEDYESAVYQEFEAIYQKICKELERYGYDFIEHEDSEESFIDMCEANEYTFRDNGEMENI